MAFTTKTYDEILDLTRAMLRNRIPEADMSDGSDYDLLCRMVAAVFVGNTEGARYLLRQIFPVTAEGDFLELHAALRGIVRAVAATAVGKAILTGTATLITQPAGSGLTHGSGATYTTDAAAQTALSAASGKTCSFDCGRERLFVLPDLSDVNVGDVFTIDGNVVAVKATVPAVGAIEVFPRLPSAPAQGTAITATIGVVVNVTCNESGSGGNRDPSDTLTVDSPATTGIDDINPTCVVAEMGGGGDEETDAELRERIRAFMSLRPASGNVAHFRAWARETEDVRLADAFVYPNFRGLSAVDVVTMGVAGARQTSTLANAKVTTKLEAEKHFSDDVLVRQLGLASTPTDVSLSITPLADFEPDWTGSFTEGGGTSTTTRVYLTASAIGTIAPGDRVLVKVVINGFDRLRQRAVADVQQSGSVYWLELEEALEAVPVGGQTIRPGGPLAQGAIDAVEATFDALGPGDTSPSTRHPGPSEAWEPVLRRSRLIAATQGLTGADSIVLNTPAADVTPSTFERVVLGELDLIHA